MYDQPSLGARTYALLRFWSHIGQTFMSLPFFRYINLQNGWFNEVRICGFHAYSILDPNLSFWFRLMVFVYFGTWNHLRKCGPAIACTLPGGVWRWIVWYIATRPQKHRKVKFNQNCLPLFWGLTKTKKCHMNGKWWQKSGHSSLQHGISAAAGGPGLHPAAPWRTRWWTTGVSV